MTDICTVSLIVNLFLFFIFLSDLITQRSIYNLTFCDLKIRQFAIIFKLFYKVLIFKAIIFKKDVLYNNLYTIFESIYMSKVLKNKSQLTWSDFQDQTGKKFIKKVLIINNWNYARTAKAIKVQRSHLYELVKKYKIEKPVNPPRIFGNENTHREFLEG